MLPAITLAIAPSMLPATTLAIAPSMLPVATLVVAQIACVENTVHGHLLQHPFGTTAGLEEV
jgi:hypothetical protein